MENNSNSQEQPQMTEHNVMHSFSVLGFELSTDYEKLWDLIHKGFIIPAWVLYGEKYWDIVQVKTIDNNKAHIIGSRGRGYEGYDHKIDNFIMSCTSCKLHYVVPQSCA
jgi:hypothetical protein